GSGFSEPGAASDLASLRTAALPRADHFEVTGQKVWTTLAQHADWCMLLCRTDPETRRREGISCLLVDMQSPGITVRPLRQMTGEAEFNEVFFESVRVPRENLLGELHGGWQIAVSALQNERGILYVVGMQILLSGARDRLFALAREPRAVGAEGISRIAGGEHRIGDVGDHARHHRDAGARPAARELDQRGAPRPSPRRAEPAGSSLLARCARPRARRARRFHLESSS